MAGWLYLVHLGHIAVLNLRVLGIMVKLFINVYRVLGHGRWDRVELFATHYFLVDKNHQGLLVTVQIPNAKNAIKNAMVKESA